MGRKKAAKKQNVVPVGFNKGVFMEFIIFLVLQGFDVYCNFAVFLNCKDDAKTYDDISKVDPSIALQKNYTNKPTSYCTRGEFETKPITELREKFNGILEVYFTFVVVSSIIFSLHFMLWVTTITFSILVPDFLQEHWDVLVKGKVGFTLAANFVQDIPCSMLAMELYLLRRGSDGLVCWQCAMDLTCLTTSNVETLLAPSTSLLSLLIVAVTISTLWKAISSFFRWSRVDECDVFIIRAATALFAGFLYACIILTPMLAILKYEFFKLPGVEPGLVGAIVDKVFIVGALFWAVGILGVCCCPLLRLIRLAG
jgi:hypothetical protein